MCFPISAQIYACVEMEATNPRVRENWGQGEMLGLWPLLDLLGLESPVGAVVFSSSLRNTVNSVGRGLAKVEN